MDWNKGRRPGPGNQPATSSGSPSIFGLISKVNKGILKTPASGGQQSSATPRHRPTTAHVPVDNTEDEVVDEQKQNAFLEAKSRIEQIQKGLWKRGQGGGKSEPSSERFKVPQLPPRPVKQTQKPDQLKGQRSTGQLSMMKGNDSDNIKRVTSLVEYDDDDHEESDIRGGSFNRKKALEEIDRYRAVHARDRMEMESEVHERFPDLEPDTVYGRDDQNMQSNRDTRFAKDKNTKDNSNRKGQMEYFDAYSTADRGYTDVDEDHEETARTGKEDQYFAPREVFDYGHSSSYNNTPSRPEISRNTSDYSDSKLKSSSSTYDNSSSYSNKDFKNTSNYDDSKSYVATDLKTAEERVRKPRRFEETKPVERDNKDRKIDNLQQKTGSEKKTGYPRRFEETYSSSEYTEKDFTRPGGSPGVYERDFKEADNQKHQKSTRWGKSQTAGPYSRESEDRYNAGFREERVKQPYPGYEGYDNYSDVGQSYNQPASRDNQPVSRDNQPASREHASRDNQPASRDDQHASRDNQPASRDNQQFRRDEYQGTGNYWQNYTKQSDGNRAGSRFQDKTGGGDMLYEEFLFGDKDDELSDKEKSRKQRSGSYDRSGENRNKDYTADRQGGYRDRRRNFGPGQEDTYSMGYGGQEDKVYGGSGTDRDTLYDKERWADDRSDTSQQSWDDRQENSGDTRGAVFRTDADTRPGLHTPGIICQDCNITCLDKEVFDVHLKSDLHLLNLQKKAQELFQMKESTQRISRFSPADSFPLTTVQIPIGQPAMISGLPQNAVTQPLIGYPIGTSVYTLDDNMSQELPGRALLSVSPDRELGFRNQPLQVVPPKPKGPLQAESVGCNSISISWGKLMRDEETMIDKYVVEYRNARETHWVTVGTTIKHDFVVDGLQELTDYLFRVFSVNGVEKSEILESVLVTTRRRKDAPNRRPRRPSPDRGRAVRERDRNIRDRERDRSGNEQKRSSVDKDRKTNTDRDKDIKTNADREKNRKANTDRDKDKDRKTNTDRDRDRSRVDDKNRNRQPASSRDRERTRTDSRERDRMRTNRNKDDKSDNSGKDAQKTDGSKSDRKRGEKDVQKKQGESKTVDEKKKDMSEKEKDGKKSGKEDSKRKTEEETRKEKDGERKKTEGPGKRESEKVEEPVEDVECLLYQEIPHMEEQPLLGLEFLWEIVSYKPTVPVRYLCKLCNTKGCASNVMISHVTGFPHKMEFFKKHDPTVYDTVSMIPAKKEQIERLNYEGRLIEDRKGRGAVKVMIMLNPEDTEGKIRFRDPVEVPAPPPKRDKVTGPVPAATMVESKFQSYFEEAVATHELEDTAVIGLSYLKEYFHPADEEPPRYICSLCNIVCTEKTVVFHVIGKKHRMAYLKIVDAVSWDITSKSKDLKKLIIRKAKELEHMEGRGELKIMVAKNARLWRSNLKKENALLIDEEEETDSQNIEPGTYDKVKQVTTLTAPMETESKTTEEKEDNQGIKFGIKKPDAQPASVKPINVLDQAKPRTKESFDWNKENASLQAKIQNQTIIKSSRKSKFITVYSEFFKRYPVIGLQWVTEFQKPDPKMEPWYMCFMCQHKLQWKNILDHVTSSSHRINYMKKSHEEKYKSLLSTISTNKVRGRAVIESYSREIIKLEGPVTGMEVMLELSINTEALKSVMKVKENLKPTATVTSKAETDNTAGSVTAVVSGSVATPSSMSDVSDNVLATSASKEDNQGDATLATSQHGTPDTQQSYQNQQSTVSSIQHPSAALPGMTSVSVGQQLPTHIPPFSQHQATIAAGLQQMALLQHQQSPVIAGQQAPVSFANQSMYPGQSQSVTGTYQGTAHHGMYSPQVTGGQVQQTVPPVMSASAALSTQPFRPSISQSISQTTPNPSSFPNQQPSWQQANTMPVSSSQQTAGSQAGTEENSTEATSIQKVIEKQAEEVLTQKILQIGQFPTPGTDVYSNEKIHTENRSAEKSETVNRTDKFSEIGKSSYSANRYDGRGEKRPYWKQDEKEYFDENKKIRLDRNSLRNQEMGRSPHTRFGREREDNRDTRGENRYTCDRRPERLRRDDQSWSKQRSEDKYALRQSYAGHEEDGEEYYDDRVEEPSNYDMPLSTRDVDNLVQKYSDLTEEDFETINNLKDDVEDPEMEQFEEWYDEFGHEVVDRYGNGSQTRHHERLDRDSHREPRSLRERSREMGDMFEDTSSHSSSYGRGYRDEMDDMSGYSRDNTRTGRYGDIETHDLEGNQYTLHGQGHNKYDERNVDNRNSGYSYRNNRQRQGDFRDSSHRDDLENPRQDRFPRNDDFEDVRSDRFSAQVELPEDDACPDPSREEIDRLLRKVSSSLMRMPQQERHDWKDDVARNVQHALTTLGQEMDPTEVGRQRPGMRNRSENRGGWGVTSGAAPFRGLDMQGSGGQSNIDSTTRFHGIGREGYGPGNRSEGWGVNEAHGYNMNPALINRGGNRGHMDMNSGWGVQSARGGVDRGIPGNTFTNINRGQWMGR